MSEVKTYRFPDDTFKTHMRYVLASDYSKLEAEAQALREEVARGERHRNDQADQIVSLRTEAAALRARVVVVPERMPRSSDIASIYQHNTGWNACLDELARLNGKVVSEGLLRRCEQMLQFYFEYLCDESAEEGDIAMAAEARDELRALLDEGKENGHA